MKTLRICRAELDTLARRIDVLRSENVQATQELADATHNGAETWHDNAAFDAAKDKKNIATLSLAKLEALIARAKVIEPSPQPKTVGVGTQVTYRDEASGLERSICFAGDAAGLMGAEWASVQAPLGEALVGAKVGETRIFRHAGSDKEITVLEILPA